MSESPAVGHPERLDGFDVGFVEVEGIRMRYAHREGPGPRLLLCNGIGANLELALPLARALAPIPVVLFDLPGTGSSPGACFIPTSRRYGKLALGVMNALAPRDDFFVGGVSWGGALAQKIARDGGVRVKGLVLMATSPGIVMVPGRPSAILRMTTPRRYVSRAFMRRNASAIYGGEIRRDPGLAGAFARMTRPPKLSGYLQQIVAMSLFTSLPWLREVRCPALVITGDDDPLVRAINGEILARLLPNARLEVIRGGGHLFTVFQPQVTASFIRGFVARCAG